MLLTVSLPYPGPTMPLMPYTYPDSTARIPFNSSLNASSTDVLNTTSESGLNDILFILSSRSRYNLMIVSDPITSTFPFEILSEATSSLYPSATHLETLASLPRTIFSTDDIPKVSSVCEATFLISRKYHIVANFKIDIQSSFVRRDIDVEKRFDEL